MAASARRVKEYLDIRLKVLGLRVVSLYGRWKPRHVEAMNESQIPHYDLLINGQIRPARSSSYFDVVDPSKGSVMARVADAGLDDMRDAIAAARQAFDRGIWREMSLSERGIYLKRLAKLIGEEAKELAALETCNVGKTIKQSTFIDVPTSMGTYEYFSGMNGELSDRPNVVADPVESVTRREPMGVVGCIIPWNYPLIMSAWKLAPALMAGNTIVLKPSPVGCVSIMHLARLIVKVGFPEGVINIVTTQNRDVAEELIRHPDVNMISFSGSSETGRQIMKIAAAQTKKCTLELGGKSANIVFADCDIEAALGGTLSAIFMNQGQMCTAGSRLLIEASLYETFLSRLVERAKKLKIGDAANYDTDFGPVASREQRDKILQGIEEAVQAGAKIECGGKVPEGEAFAKGAYLEPTILSVDPAMKIAREEVFGPVLSVMKFSSFQEAIDLANHSVYGLAACVWTKDQAKAQEAAKHLECGTVWINTYGGFYDQAPFGGCKQSGFGRECGVEGLLEFTQTKHICTDRSPGGRPLVSSWF